MPSTLEMKQYQRDTKHVVLGDEGLLGADGSFGRAMKLTELQNLLMMI